MCADTPGIACGRVLAQANKWADVPVIFGTNLDEGTIFVPALTLVVPGTPFPPDAAAMEKGTCAGCE